MPDLLSADDRSLEKITESLRSLRLLGAEDRPEYARLAGGVSADIWRVTVGGRTFCIKRALEKLRVLADWYAPTERSQFEVAWLKRVAGFIPGAVPKVLAVDEHERFFAMEYLEPARHPLWKHQLRDGHVDGQAAEAVGQRLGRIHAAAAGMAEIREAFSTRYIFEPIRIDPYLREVARRHADLAPQLCALADRTLSGACAFTLVHGDISPKNILIGPDGPVFLDAECAWYGDPCFDIAFCLNHLLLKCLWVPAASDALLDAFRTLWNAYERSVDWEPKENIATRTATLLPALFLARVDGKSPVEYITDEAQKDRVRRVGRQLISNPVRHPDDVCARWKEELERV